MRPEVLFFQISSLAALLLLFRFTWRTSGKRTALLFFAYLLVVSIGREAMVRYTSVLPDQPVPYRSLSTLGQIGFVNLGVVAGWMFTTHLSLHLARMIQRRNLPGTGIWMTLPLTALVASTIAFTVEVTGMRLRLWEWLQPDLFSMPGLPFDMPFDGFEGWSATAFMVTGIWFAMRFPLFSPKPWRHAAIAVALVGAWALADYGMLVVPYSPRKVVTLVYILIALYLGARAPRQDADLPDEEPIG